MPDAIEASESARFWVLCVLLPGRDEAVTWLLGAEPERQCRRPLSLLSVLPHTTLLLPHPRPPGRLLTDCLGHGWQSRQPELRRGRGPRGGGSGVSAGEEEEGRWRRSWSPRCRPSTGVCWNVRLRRPRGWVPGPGRGRSALAGRAPGEEPTPGNLGAAWPWLGATTSPGSPASPCG